MLGAAYVSPSATANAAQRYGGDKRDHSTSVSSVKDWCRAYDCGLRVSLASGEPQLGVGVGETGGELGLTGRSLVAHRRPSDKCDRCLGYRKRFVVASTD